MLHGLTSRSSLWFLSFAATAPAQTLYSQSGNSSFSSVISNWNLCPVLCFQCLAADTLAAYGMSEQSRIDERGLQEICPTMIQQLDSQACKTQQDQEPETSPRPTYVEGKTDYPLRDLNMMPNFYYQSQWFYHKILHGQKYMYAPVWLF